MPDREMVMEKKPKRFVAPKGNDWWKLRSKHGRDKLFMSPELLWEAACEYFEDVKKMPIKRQEIKVVDNEIVKVNAKLARPFTLKGLCLYLGVSDKYFIQFKREQVDKPSARGFLTVISQIEDTIYNQKFDGATAGIFNARIISRDLGLIEKTQSEATVTQVNITPTPKEAAEIRKGWEKKI